MRTTVIPITGITNKLSNKDPTKNGAEYATRSPIEKDKNLTGSSRCFRTTLLMLEIPDNIY